MHPTHLMLGAQLQALLWEAWLSQMIPQCSGNQPDVTVLQSLCKTKHAGAVGVSLGWLTFQLKSIERLASRGGHVIIPRLPGVTGVHSDFLSHFKKKNNFLLILCEFHMYPNPTHPLVPSYPP